MITRAIENARKFNRQITVLWIDLADAYGSIPHQLVHFATEWYHVTNWVQDLVFPYYEELCARVHCRSFSTNFFPHDVGVFQGCTLSTALFNIVFQLILDYVRSTDELGEYQFSLERSERSEQSKSTSVQNITLFPWLLLMILLWSQRIRSICNTLWIDWTVC
jgi:hypothetical protein